MKAWKRVEGRGARGEGSGARGARGAARGARLPSPFGRGAGGEGLRRGDWKDARRGFTLVEMLAVVVIIGILAGLITAAAVRARATARTAVMIAEIGNMDLAAKAYREKFGDYFPDFTDPDATRRHISRAFPHCPPSTYPNFSNTGQFNPTTALVFWLGGAVVDGQPVGFSANPRNPFDNSTSRVGPFFEFDPSRIYAVGGGAYQYYPAGIPLGSVASGYGPYVYFRARSQGGYQGHPGWSPGPCYPARDTQVVGGNSWANHKTFQIRGPGLDGRHGSGVMFPTGEDYDAVQHDDVSNFSQGKFGDAIP